MKNTYLAITTHTEVNGKEYNFASVFKHTPSNNLWSQLHGIRNLSTVNVCETKKEAHEIVDFWNECFEKNGTYGIV